GVPAPAAGVGVVARSAPTGPVGTGDPALPSRCRCGGAGRCGGRVVRVGLVAAAVRAGLRVVPAAVARRPVGLRWWWRRRGRRWCRLVPVPARGWVRVAVVPTRL